MKQLDYDRAPYRRVNRLIVIVGTELDLTPDQKECVRRAISDLGVRERATVMHGDGSGVGKHAGYVTRSFGWPEVPMPRPEGSAGSNLQLNAILGAARNFQVCGWEVTIVAFPKGISSEVRNFVETARSLGFLSVRVVEFAPAKEGAVAS